MTNPLSRERGNSLQTGATGIGSVWATCAVVVDTTGWSAARAFYSGVAQVLNMVKVGADGVAQADIALFPPGTHGYI